MARIISIDQKDFAALRENNWFYIDKTDFIKKWWEQGHYVTSITRPGGFGKTLNISMVEHFFSVEYAGRGDLFEGLSIWADERFRKLQGTYPVISLSFADVKKDTILEFKVFQPRREKELEDTVQAALAQIDEKDYAAVLRAKGIADDRIRRYGFAFRGKEVLIGE